MTVRTPLHMFLALTLAAGSAQALPARAAAGSPSSSALAPTAAPASPATGSPAAMRFLPPQPLLVGIVQLTAVNSLFRMMSGNDKGQDTTDAMIGVLQLLKDQVDGPLSIGFYTDATGHPESFVAAARLKQASLTRELLDGASTLGSDEKNPTKKTTYRGQTLITIDVPKTATGSLGIPLEPTFTVTDSDYLVVGGTAARVKAALDAGAATTVGLGSRADLVAMMRQFPPAPTLDVWLFVPKLSGPLAMPGKSPITLPLASLPIGPTVVTLRFTPAGVRFEGLASVDRPKAP